jgi:hypothetical protein
MQMAETVELLTNTTGFLAEGAWPGLSERHACDGSNQFLLAGGAWLLLSEDTSAEAHTNSLRNLWNFLPTGHVQRSQKTRPRRLKSTLLAGHGQRSQKMRLRRLNSIDLLIELIEVFAEGAWPDTSAGAQSNRCPKRTLHFLYRRTMARGKTSHRLR